MIYYHLHIARVFSNGPLPASASPCLPEVQSSITPSIGNVYSYTYFNIKSFKVTGHDNYIPLLNSNAF